MSEVIILYGQSPSNQFMNRFVGPHRLATELRNANISTSVILGLGYYSLSEMTAMIETNIDDKTLVLGISTTFFVEYSPRNAHFPSRLYKFGDSYKNDIKEITNHFKIKYPQLKIVIGGPSARSKVTEDSQVDLFIEGYADNEFLNYILNLKNNNRIFYSSYHCNVPLISNLNNNFNFRNCMTTYISSDNILFGETLPLEISRGCIFKCKFCSYPLRGKNKNDLSYIKDENILYQELIQNYENHGTTSYIFVDDTFNDSQDKLELLYNIFKKLPFKIKFSAYIRIDLLYAYPKSIDLLKEMGICGAFFGIESLNPQSRKASSKGFNNDKLYETIRNVNNIWKDVFITSSFIYGLPYDDANTVQDWTTNIVFNSGLFDHHDLIFQPLYLVGPNNSTYTSDFDLEMDNYGYKFSPHSPYWVNSTTSFREMSNLSKHTNIECAKISRPFSSFYCSILLGYGLTTEEIKSLDSHNEIDINFVEDLTIKKYTEYFNKLVSYYNFS
jgi:predicted nucleotidyltransferase